ncbi:MAG TPA: YihY family inner membrane protein [Usitatibacteraceae bacterium]|nr:YihY family inner membrane protein [Usitatibacteraceae bacterium]
MKPDADTLRAAWRFLAFVVRRWREDRCPQVAAALAFTTLLALVPLFAIAAAVLSRSPFFEDAMTQFKIFLLLNLVPEIAGKIITVYMREFAGVAGRLTSVGLVALVAMALATMLTMHHALSDIWRVRQRRPLWLLVAGYAALLALGPLLVGVSLAATSWLVATSLDGVAVAAPVEAAVLRLVPIAVSALAFFLLYRVLPNRHVPWRHAAAGGLLAAVAFEAMKSAFAAYLRAVPTYNLIYGAFAAIPVFLIWLHLAWMVVLLGAEFTAALAYRRHDPWRDGASPALRLRGALEVVRRLPSADEPPRRIARLRGSVPMPGDRLEDLLEALALGGIVERRRAGWRLAKPLGEVTYADLWQAAQPGGGAPSVEDWAACAQPLGEAARSMQDALSRPVAPG